MNRHSTNGLSPSGAGAGCPPFVFEVVVQLVFHSVPGHRGRPVSSWLRLGNGVLACWSWTEFSGECRTLTVERKTSPERPSISGSAPGHSSTRVNIHKTAFEKRKKSLMVTQFEFPYVKFFFLIKKRDKIQRQEECAQGLVGFYTNKKICPENYSLK